MIRMDNHMVNLGAITLSSHHPFKILTGKLARFCPSILRFRAILKTQIWQLWSQLPTSPSVKRGKVMRL